MNEQSRIGAQPRTNSQDGHVPTPNEAAKPRIELDAAASAALAQAVTAARQGGAHAQDRRAAERLQPPSATVSLPDNGAKSSRARAKGPAIHSLVVVAALAAGAVGAQVLQSRSGTDTPWAEMAQALRQSQDQGIGLAGDLKALRTEIDAIRRSLEQSDADIARFQAEDGERFERSATASDALAQDTAAKLARLGEKLDRLETGSKDSASGFNAVIARLERIEDRIAATTARAAPVPAPAVQGPEATSTESPALTGSLNLRVPAKDATVEGWVLHEVHNDTALIESRNGRLVEVAQGEMVPGVGRVEAIERRGKRWVVVTPKGVIGTMR
jgi:hypothetical protein